MISFINSLLIFSLTGLFYSYPEIPKTTPTHTPTEVPSSTPIPTSSPTSTPHPTIPLNDLCPGHPAQIGPIDSPWTVTGDLEYARNDYGGSCQYDSYDYGTAWGERSSSHDIVYYLDLCMSYENVSIKVTRNSADVYIRKRCDDHESEISCRKSNGVIQIEYLPSGTYYIIVDGYYSCGYYYNSGTGWVGSYSFNNPSFELSIEGEPSTSPPVDFKPCILLAGYWKTDLNVYEGRKLEIIALTNDDYSYLMEKTIHLKYDGLDTGLRLMRYDDVFRLEGYVGPTENPASYLLELEFSSMVDDTSYVWPYLYVE